MYNAKSGSIKIDKTEMDYVSFGTGKRPFVMLPGVGDGLRSIRGLEVPMAMLYHEAAKDFTVYMLSRRNSMPIGFTTRDMAADVYTAMQRLGILKADVLGVSQGGMVAQYLAIDHPEVIRKLVLVVTLARPNETEKQVIRHWIELAKRGLYREIMMDTAEKSYTQQHLRKTRWMHQLAGNVGKPKSFDKFITMAKACIAHDAYDELPKIKTPTLVIGGTDDRVLTGEGSLETAEQIPGSQLLMYEGLGHALYEEADDFMQKVLEFYAK